MGKILLTKLKAPSVFRKIAMGTWRTVGDPSVYGFLYLDMEKALQATQKYSKERNIKITPTHLVAKAMAIVLKNRPEINGMIRGSRIYLRKHVSLFLQINIPKSSSGPFLENELSGCVIHQAENMNMEQLVQAINKEKDKIISGKPNDFSASTAIVKLLPWILVRLYLNIGSFLIYTLNLNLSFFGLPKDPFGSVMITNFGSLGGEMAFAPLVPYSKVPLLITVGALKDGVVAENGKVVIKPLLPIGVTFDHRFVDGVHGAKMYAEFKQVFAEPEKYLFS